MATWMLSRNSWRAAQSNALPTDIRHDVIDPRLALLMDSPFQASAMSAKLCRFMVPRMLPPIPFVGNSDILAPSPIVSFILTLPKQPQLLLMLRAAWLMSLQFILNPTLVK